MTGILAKLAAVALVALPMGSTVRETKLGPREDLIVSVDWLKQHINDRDLVLLHISSPPPPGMPNGNPDSYVVGHIPGARQITLQAASRPTNRADTLALSLEMPDPAALRAALEARGISDNSRIVVYYGGQMDYTSSTRVLLNLDWIGLGGRAVWLDGGLPAWKRAGGALQTDTPSATPGKISAKAIKPLVVSAAWVNENSRKPGFVLIDGRARSWYDGVSGQGSRVGHIPGAKSIPYTDILDDEGMLEPADKLAALFTAAGAKPGDTIVGYCHIGMQATGMLLAARTLGYKVLLYDGSYTEWERTSYPVEK